MTTDSMVDGSGVSGAMDKPPGGSAKTMVSAPELASASVSAPRSVQISLSQLVPSELLLTR